MYDFRALLLQIKNIIQKNQLISILAGAMLITLFSTLLMLKSVEDYVLLEYKNFTNLDTSQKLVEWLTDHRFSFKTSSNLKAVYVLANDYPEIQKSLVDENSLNIVGFELLDKSRSFGSSSFMEGIRYRRALEGELARTISAMANVRTARVHLAIPKKSAFIRETIPASASVFLKIRNKENFNSDLIESIVNLIASSISGMRADNITVVDQDGNLLSENISNKEEAIPSLQQAKIKQKYLNNLEKQYKSAIQDILTPLLGKDNYKIKFDINLKFIEPSAESASNNTISDEDNYATSQGNLKILNVTTIVLLESKKILNANGMNILKPYTHVEMVKISNLITNVIPFNTKRGDRVIVDNIFITEPSAIPVNNNFTGVKDYVSENRIQIAILALGMVAIFLISKNKKFAANFDNQNRETTNKVQSNNIKSTVLTPVKIVAKNILELSVDEIYKKIKNESPEIIALVLGNIEPNDGGELLYKFPPEERELIINKTYAIQTAKIETLKNLQQKLTNNLQISGFNVTSKELSKLNGVIILTKIIWFSESAISNSLNQEIKSFNSELYFKIDSSSPSFEEIAGLNKSKFSDFFKNISMDLLLPALKGTEEGIALNIINLVPDETNQGLIAELKEYPNVKIKETTAAQAKILRKLAQYIVKHGLNTDNLIFTTS